jgi:predicted nucleic acid-binding protein
MAGNEPVLVAVVCEAGPLIHLDESGCLDLLADFQQVLVPEAVWAEVARHRPAALTAPAVRLEKIATGGPVSPELESLSRALLLHAGERAALQVAQESAGRWLLTDDTAARLAARSLNITAHGTIGILLRAIRRRQRTKAEVLAMLRALPRSTTLHLKRGFLNEIVRDVEALP